MCDVDPLERAISRVWDLIFGLQDERARLMNSEPTRARDEQVRRLDARIAFFRRKTRRWVSVLRRDNERGLRWSPDPSRPLSNGRPRLPGETAIDGDNGLLTAYLRSKM